VHLYREHFLRVEELQQQRKSLKAAGQLSQHLLRKLHQQLTDRLPFERPLGYLARVVVAVAEQPCFSDGSARQGSVSKSAKRRPPHGRY
jgi:hypothetical protein